MKDGRWIYEDGDSYMHFVADDASPIVVDDEDDEDGGIRYVCPRGTSVPDDGYVLRYTAEVLDVGLCPWCWLGIPFGD